MTITTRPTDTSTCTSPLSFRIDSFRVPEPARREFEAAMQRNMAFIASLPGFRGHVVFEKTGGPTTFDLVTVATWASEAAHAAAVTAVRAYYQEIGFDPPAMMARWGVTAELGAFRAVDEARGGELAGAVRTGS